MPFAFACFSKNVKKDMAGVSEKKRTVYETKGTEVSGAACKQLLNIWQIHYFSPSALWGEPSPPYLKKTMISMLLV